MLCYSSCDGGGAICLSSSSTLMNSRQLVIPDPENFHYAIHEESEFLILASDGVWDTVRNSEAVTRVRRWLREGDGPAAAAEKLADLAIKLSSQDNVTAVVLKFSGRTLPPLHMNANSMLRRARSEMLAPIT